MTLQSNAHTSEPGAALTAPARAEHDWSVIDVKQRSLSDPKSRLLSKVDIDPETGCWNFRGWRDKAGYGRISQGRVADGSISTHRFAYRLWVGEIPAGLQLDHLCRNTSCCNPAHLEPVTGRENLLRGETFQAHNAAKTHCPQGHPYDESNTYVVKPRNLRACRACMASRVPPLSSASPELRQVIDEAVRMYESGDSALTISKRFGRSEAAVFKWLKRAGVTTRRPGRQGGK